MKRGIFNQYVEFVCEECGITKEELFTKSRKTKLAMSRYLLYSICYQRPMTIVQIVDLMSENGYDTSRTNIEYGIAKIKEMNDGDINRLISIAVNHISKEESLC
jgi:hypothetical protein